MKRIESTYQRVMGEPFGTQSLFQTSWLISRISWNQRRMSFGSSRSIGLDRRTRPDSSLPLRIDPGLLKQLRLLAAKQNKPYQTYIHELLESAAKKAA